MFAVSFLSSFMHNSSKNYFKVAKKVLRYIKQTFDIHYEQIKDFKLYSYINDNWAGCADDRKVL